MRARTSSTEVSPLPKSEFPPPPERRAVGERVSWRSSEDVRTTDALLGDLDERRAYEAARADCTSARSPVFTLTPPRRLACVYDGGERPFLKPLCARGDCDREMRNTGEPSRLFSSVFLSCVKLLSGISVLAVVATRSLAVIGTGELAFVTRV